jgi:DNA-directed RNA polymerase beta subunit
MQSLFRITKFKSFKYAQPVRFSILLENLSLEEYMSTTNPRRYFNSGKWTLLFYPTMKIYGNSIITKQQMVKFVSKYRFSYAYLTKTSETLPQQIFDITAITRIMTSKYKYTSPAFDKLLDMITSVNKQEVLYYIISDKHQLGSINNLMITQLLRKIYLVINRKQDKDPDINKRIKLPDEFIIHLIIKGQSYFVSLVENGNWSNIKIIISYFKNLYNRVSKNISIDEDVVDASKDSADSSIIKKPEITYDKISSINKTIDKQTMLFQSVSGKTSKNDVSLNVDEFKKDVVKKTVPKPRQSEVSIDKANKKISDHIIEPEVVKPHTIIPLLESDVSSKTLITTKYIQTEYKYVLQTFEKYLDSHKYDETGFTISDTNISDMKSNPRDIQDSELIVLSANITFNENPDKSQKFEIVLPKLKENGTLRLMGNDYTIINQLINLPITFPKPGSAKFVSNTTSIMIDSLKNKMMVKVGGVRLPIGLICSYIFGLDKFLKSYNIKYHFDTTTDNNHMSIQISKDKYLIVDNDQLNKYQYIILSSLFPYHMDEFDIEEEPFSKEWYQQLISDITGNAYTYKWIKKSFDIALDGKTVEILHHKSLPTNMFDIMNYMIKNSIDGYSVNRNDLRELRLRSYEAILQVASDQLVRNASDYSRMVKYSNNSKPIEFKVDKNSFLKRIISSESVNMMTKVNPVDEVTNLQKVTFAGYKGIPAETVPSTLRGLDNTYYGTVDPINTPEGGTIGVNQVFTSDAAVVSRLGTIIPYSLDRKDVNILSLASSLSPFISKTESTRAIMMVNQIKQAIPVENSEPPAVMTGYEAVVPLLSDQFSIKSPCSGKVISSNDSKISIKCNDGNIKEVSINQRLSRSNVGIYLESNFKSNVKEGDTVSKDDILSDTQFIKSNLLSLGSNYLTTYMFWKGLTYEDGYVISESVAKRSVVNPVFELFMFLEDEAELKFINIEKNKLVDAGDTLISAISPKMTEIINLGIVDIDNIISVGNKYALVSPCNGEVIDYKIYVNSKKVNPELINILKQYNIDYQDEPFKYKDKIISGVFIKIYVKSRQEAELGDKLANRHAAKGVITKIELDENMPVLPDGRKVEVIINPLSVINRTNTGQVYELYCGEISYQLKKLITTNNKSTFIPILERISKVDNTGYMGRITKLLKSDPSYYKNFMEFVNKYYFPFIVPPFNEMNYNQILNIMNILRIPNKYKLSINGIDHPMYEPVGYMYFYRLHHLANIKLHARSLGSVDPRTGQPLGGKKVGGGLRVGEMDQWSLMSWGANHIIDELFSAGSDDISIKKKMYRDIIDSGKTNLSEIKHNTAITTKYMKSLFNGILIDME